MKTIKGITMVEEKMKRCRTIPQGFPYSWATGYKNNKYKLWTAFTYQGNKQVFRWMEPGTFEMGSPNNEPERQERERQHTVTLSRGFWMADTACTQALWEAVMGKNPNNFKGAQLPVENVSWDDVQEFLNELNGVQPDLKLRLPTEAEWEYACRAGTQTPFSFGENITTDQVNYNGNCLYNDASKGEYRGKTVEVKSLPPNPWGLYEMHGNVWEWCADWFGDYQEEKAENPTGPEIGSSRVLRGGGWVNGGWGCRSAYRAGLDPANRWNVLGFRLARGHRR